MSDNQPVSTGSAPRLAAVAGIRPLLLLVGVAAAVAAGVGIALWSQGPTYKMVYGNLSDADAAKMITALDQSGIPNKFENGAVLVPAERVSEARMGLVGKGLPGSSDFSMLDKDPGFGVSQFMENARYQRALEGELARTISGVRGVSGARVLLAVPQQSAFVRDRRAVSASVMLEMRGGSRLDRETIDAIVSLVASGVPELDAEHVTVVDNAGRLLSAPEKDGELAARERQMELARRIEQDYSDRIVRLLTTMLGPNRVNAQVWAETEGSSTEEAREQYSPESQIVRSEQTSEDVARAGGGPQGVPGALSNQPPQGGTALAPGVQPTASAQQATAADAGNSSRQATRNYEIDRTVAYTKTPAGRLTRLSVAVVVDNQRTTDADGKVTETPLTDAQIASITTLVRDAVGFDEARGDRISVVNQSFQAEAVAAEQIEKEPLWQNPLLRDILKLVAGLVVIALLVLFVVRPLIRGLAVPARAALAGNLPQGGPVEGQVMAANRPGNAIAYEQQIAQARSLVAKDPARVAQVVTDWVQNDE